MAAALVGMAFVMLIGLVVGYGWSVRLLHRQANDVRPTIAEQTPTAADVRVLRLAARRPAAARRAVPLGIVRARRPGSAL